MAITLEQQADVFKALCDVRRLRILEALRDGEECACNLAEQLDMPQSTFSYHMKVLCDSGIVANRQDGKWTHYSLCDMGRTRALHLLEEITTEHEGVKAKVNNC